MTDNTTTSDTPDMPEEDVGVDLYIDRLTKQTGGGIAPEFRKDKKDRRQEDTGAPAGTEDR